MKGLLLIGLNHTTADLSLREKLALDAAEQAAAVAALRQAHGGCEVVLLATCNRVEIYAAGDGLTHDRLIEFLAARRALDAETLRPHIYAKSERGAVEHLFRVAASLDSMVLGETQILGQVRAAYESARLASATGPVLNPLFQRSLAVAREVMTGTSLAEGRISIASVAVDYARQIFDSFADKTVVSIGAGKMATLVLKSLAALNPGRLIVCNRDPEKARALAAQFNAAWAGLDGLDDLLAQADVVVSSTGASHPLIGHRQFEQVMKRRGHRPVFLIDIAMPRDIDPTVGELENVYLYNLDDLQQVVSTAQSLRRGEIDAAMEIIDRHARAFDGWHRARELGPIIDALYRRHHQLAQSELRRTLAQMPDATPAQRAALEEMARRLVNKLLHDPVQALRESGVGAVGHSAVPNYAHALQMLFGLNVDSEADQPRMPKIETDDRAIDGPGAESAPPPDRERENPGRSPE
jgi:glutamyl-tRNA reductase